MTPPLRVFPCDPYLPWPLHNPPTHSAVTFFCVIGASLWDDLGSLAAASPEFPNRVRSLLGSVGVLVWSLRLGSYLFTRIQREGKDSRFDVIKPNTLRFFNAWQLQATWVGVEWQVSSNGTK